VARLPGLLTAGETRETILANYPYLEPEDIDAAAMPPSWQRNETVGLSR
jgi:uncharacterized protein (DUF433 family)